MPALPARTSLDGSTGTLTTGAFQAAIGDFRDFIGALLGTSGSKANAQKALGVAVVDRAYVDYGVYNSLTPTLPYDSVPQNNQGTQLFALTLTPKSTTNRIRVSVSIPWSCADTTPGRVGGAAIFVNDEVAAKFAVYEVLPFDGYAGILSTQREFVAGTLAPITIAVRVGCNAGNFLLCGNRFSQIGAGSQAAVLLLEELTA